MASETARSAVFAALGDPLRLRIADELARSDRTPGELLEWLEISSALLAHHLDVLESAGVVERRASEADGRKRFVRLVPHHRHLLVSNGKMQRVVFVCTHNSARSQLAAGLWQRLTGQVAASGGTEPAEQVHPLAAQTARRHDLDLGDGRPTRITSDMLRGATVITVCDRAHDDLARPLSRLHWSVPDPVAVGTMRAFERAFDDLNERIVPLVNSLQTTPSTKGTKQ
jgi:protein-tyrosine-phosphatase/DNA-binding HxlR family transcriptional regulator